VDKDHLERSFASEMDVLRKKNADTEQRLDAANRQHEELAERMREDREEARKNKRAKNQAESSLRALEEQLDTATHELTDLKNVRSQLERQV
jgi:chromosome segregation ATPase